VINRDNGQDFVDIDLANTGNRIYWRWMSDDKKFRSQIQLRPLREDDGTGENIVEEFWFEWKLSPMLTLRLGKAAQTFAINAPSQTVSRDGSTIVGLNYCNIHGGTAREQFKAYIRPADNVRIELAAIEPDNDGGEVVAGFGNENAGINGETNREENVLPRLDLAVNFKVANFTFEPSATYMTQEYDQVTAGSDDNVDIWGLALGIKASFGPLSFEAEVAGGENLGSGNYVGARFRGFNAGAAAGYVDNAGNNRVADTDCLSYFIDVGFKFGPATLHLIYGGSNYETDGDPSVANDGWDVSPQMFVVNLPISVAKGFTIKPEIGWYDNDDSARVGANNFDYGDEFAIGVGFILKF
jgi:hypothetical protein